MPTFLRLLSLLRFARSRRRRPRFAAACSSADAPFDSSPPRGVGSQSPPVSNVAFSLPPADFDHDGKADISLRAPDGRWLIDFAANGLGMWEQEYPGYGGAASTPCSRRLRRRRQSRLAEMDASGVWHIDYAANGLGAWTSP